MPPNPIPPDTAEEDVAWILERRLPQPIATFETPVRLTSREPAPPRSYIYCSRSGPGDVFRPFAERAGRDAGWRLYEIDASHSPHVTAPETLRDVLIRILDDEI